MGWLVLIFGYVVAGLAATWAGSWYFQAFAWGSVAVTTLAAVRMREYWPVVYPSLSLFYAFPALLIGYSLITPLAYFTADPIVDWLPWLGVTSAVSVTFTAFLVLKWRKHIDREWAVVTTFFVVLAYVAWGLVSLNSSLPQPSPHCEQVAVVHASPGGYRQGGPRLTITPVGPYRSESTHPVSWSALIAAERGEPVCIYVYRGALGWRWVQVGKC